MKTAVTGRTGRLLCLILGMHACSSPNPEAEDGRIRVAVTILPQAEFVEKVGGEKVRVTVVIPPGAEPHSYEPAPSQLMAIGAARLFVELGSGIPFEKIWMEKLLGVGDELLVVDCSEGIDLLSGDPHVWLSPRRARIMVANICRALVRIDPDSRAYYERNRDVYLQELDALDEQIGRALAGAKVRTFLVYHPSWGYFARDYGLEQIAVEEEGKEPTVQSLTRLVQQARARNVKTVFASPQFDTRSARTVAAELGIRVVAVDPLARNYADNLRRIAGYLVQQ